MKLLMCKIVGLLIKRAPWEPEAWSFLWKTLSLSWSMPNAQHLS